MITAFRRCRESVSYTHLLLKRALEFEQHDYYHFLTGVDLPVCPITDINDLFQMCIRDRLCYDELTGDLIKEELRDGTLY